jgi:hypothetical protein
MEYIDIDKIVKKAKESISCSNAHSVDKVAKIYINMLEELGYEKEADEVYDYYREKWS